MHVTNKKVSVQKPKVVVNFEIRARICENNIPRYANFNPEF